MSTMSQETAFQPRKGQQDLVEYLPQIQRGDTLTVQWPTGYGKSIGFALAWKHCHEIGIANRLLMVVANDTQRQQIVNDFAGDCRLVGAPCEGGVWSFERSAGDLRMARIGEVLVFVCTVQQLEASMARGGVNTLKDMLQTVGTKWMAGFDEFHHYGEAMAWGDAAKLAMEHAQFSLAMSATPYRRGADTIFPEPKLCVSYREAEEGGCVKPMVCHSYEYAVAVIQDGEEVANYTTTELHRIASGDLDQWEERKNIRYSPQYLHPLILHPIRRLREQRAKTGKRLQMLVRAMSCRHAKLVCEQIKIFADGLNVDWIGTGTSGRSDKDNRNILAQFCPPKNKAGNRPEASIDVLVQVSMAGEGFDSVNVCEIIDLFPVSARALSGRATQDKQFYGRGARIIRGAESLPLSVNVPSDHPLHAWAGRSLGAWMDSCGSFNDAQPQEAPEPPAFDPWDFPELPKEREIELITVITDKQMYESFERSVCERRGYDKERDRPEIMDLYLYAANQHAKEQSKQARSFQVREYLDAIVGRIALVRAKQTEEVSGAVIGRFKKEANAAIKRNFGRSREEMTEDELEVAAQWLLRQFQNMKGLPL
jgi:superfamily II DNA or RNA helicase